MAQLTPVMSIAGAGLFPNPAGNIGVALIVPTGLSNAVSTYSSVPVVSALQGVWSNAVVVGNTITSNTLVSLLTLGSSNFPAITSVLPSGANITSVVTNGSLPTFDELTKYFSGNLVSYQSNAYMAIETSTGNVPSESPSDWEIYTPLYSLPSVATFDASQILGNGDLSVFCLAFSAAYGYAEQSNSTVTSINSNEVLNYTFNSNTGGMTTLTTGSLNQVSNNLPVFGDDLSKLGKLINLGTLSNYGLPGELLAQIGRVAGGIPPSLGLSMVQRGITENEILNLASGINTLTSTQEKIVYEILSEITGAVLSQVLAVLGVTLTNLTNLAQLLDLRQILPTSYTTLLCPTTNTLIPIFLSNGSVNTALIPTISNLDVTSYTGVNTTSGYQTLKAITPPDLALSNKAFAYSLQQIRNIGNSTLPAFSISAKAMETNSDLPAIQALTVALPSNVPPAYTSNIGDGSGPDGKFTISDVIGVMNSSVFNSGFVNVAAQIQSINSASLISVYSYMGNTLAGDYNVPDPMDPSFTIVEIPSGPAQGTYTTINQAFTGPGSPGTGLIPAAVSAIGNIAAANPNTVTSTNTIWLDMTSELQREQYNQTKAQLNFGLLSVYGISTSAVMSFASSLHQYGVDVKEGGASEILTAMANQNTLSGQALIASLREGRNIQALEPSNIQLDTQLTN
jgi:hypothetical protein